MLRLHGMRLAGRSCVTLPVSRLGRVAVSHGVTVQDAVKPLISREIDPVTFRTLA